MSDEKRVKGFEGSFGFGPSDRPEVRPLPFRIMAVGNFCGANRSEARNPAVIEKTVILAKAFAQAYREVLGKDGKEGAQ